MWNFGALEKVLPAQCPLKDSPPERARRRSTRKRCVQAPSTYERLEALHCGLVSGLIHRRYLLTLFFALGSRVEESGQVFIGLKFAFTHQGEHFHAAARRPCHLEGLSKTEEHRCGVPRVDNRFFLGKLNRVLKVVRLPDSHALFVEPVRTAEYAANAE